MGIPPMLKKERWSMGETPMPLKMIQQQTYVDICDNTGGKEGMCIKVLKGSSSSGKFKRRVAKVGDVIICVVKRLCPPVK